ncbi:MBL fold metallo-hydrolase [Chitinophaga flava]|uniref:MBL fold metallo-hydrolase n=1 Tax=Chitinophaga flava TaxID=2259036 RepID=UPI001FE68617|nr:MBL fold metallo-hydrolase [Chitinophaga flava]
MLKCGIFAVEYTTMQHKSLTSRERILRSRNFKEGAFQNLTLTPIKADDVTYFTMLKEAMNRPGNVKPEVPLPVVKAPLRAVSGYKPVVTWFGHSSYLIQIKGLNILVDPVFSGNASPMPFTVKAFPGSDAYTAADMPPIDILIITHNHYDHLDKKTIAQLLPSTKAIYTGLGVGKDIRTCGSYPADRITEMDWWETIQISDEVSLTATPARHFSGRGLKRGGSLWASFVLHLHGYTLFLGGDSGYDTHFKQIGAEYGPFDLAILECGQYNYAWPFIHMAPEQTVQAALDLDAKVLMPVHWAKFVLSNHAWNEPPKRVTAAAAEKGLAVTTPMIGEQVIVGESYPHQQWWNL